MCKKISRIIACVMLIVGVGFIIFAFNNPQFSWPWNNTANYAIYLIYLILMVVLFIAPFKGKLMD